MLPFQLKSESSQFQLQLDLVESKLYEEQNVISRLQQNLNYALAKYENKIEEEKERIRTNRNVAIYFSPLTKDNAQQVNFISFTSKQWPSRSSTSKCW